jgi:uncharacterized YkwD family protein
MKQSITVMISSVLTIGLLVSPVAAESVEGKQSDEVLKLQLEKVEKSNVLPSKYVFYKYILNKKGESTPKLHKLLVNATKNMAPTELEKDENKQDTSKVKEVPENKKAQTDVKKQEPSKTTVKVEQEKKEATPKATTESKETTKESVQVPAQEKTTSNSKVEAQPVEKTTESSQPTQSTVKEEASQPATAKEEPTQQVDDSIMLQVVDLTNKEREKAGLQPLQVDSALMANAQEKSLDMKNNNYFSHQSPTLGSPFDQMKNRGITYKAAGENIAKGQTTAEQVVEGWMNSAGHRANILDSKFTHIGVGYVAEGNYWTQQFIQK